MRRSSYGRRGGWRGIVLGVMVVAGAATVNPSLVGSRNRVALAGVAGSAGTDVRLPATASSTTVSGHGVFANLRITVNQTKDLVNQAVSVSWEGASPTFSDGGGFSGQYSGNYLQMFQCWSKDAHTAPLPEQCEFGGEGHRPYPVSGQTAAYERIIARPGDTCTAAQPSTCLSYEQLAAKAKAAPAEAYLDPTNFILDPFHAVDGTLVNATVDYNAESGGLPYKPFGTNPFFDYNTTNEVDFTRTYGDGTGQELFQVDTGLEAPGLGCGQLSLRPGGGAAMMPQCWLVIVPRGTPRQENPANQAGQMLVTTSPLGPGPWSNRLAVPLQFNPIGTSCVLSSNVRRVVGGELAAPAVANWQPTICSLPGAPPFSYGALSEDAARSLITGASPGGTGLAVVSRPLDPSTVAGATAAVYAPLTLSGVAIGFNIQRVGIGPDGRIFPDEAPLFGRRVAQLKLTPRLVAKLLTESYASEFYGGVPATYSWATKNAREMPSDPDFLQFNPEFKELQARGVDASQLVVEQSTSDAANAVWHWVLADPEARSWLDGKPDPWGMLVNPRYSTNRLVNPAGVGFGTPEPVNFPKSDPYCLATPNEPLYKFGDPPKLARDRCFQDWSAYVGSMRDAAASTRAGNPGAHLTLNQQQGATASNAWQADGPQTVGYRFMMAVTDSAQASRYGLQTAQLSRDGDDGGGREFVALNERGLLGGQAAMVASGTPGVLRPNPTAGVAGAYPLAMLTYAVAIPAHLDPTARRDYAQFVTYAITNGQVPGTSFGHLLPGYVSLPQGLRDQAARAAAAILNPVIAPPPPSSSADGVALAPSAPPTDRTPQGETGSGSPAGQGSASQFRPASFPLASGDAAQHPMSNLTTASQPPSPAANQPVALAGRTSSQPIGSGRLAIAVALLVGLLASLGAVALRLTGGATVD